MTLIELKVVLQCCEVRSSCLRCLPCLHVGQNLEDQIFLSLLLSPPHCRPTIRTIWRQKWAPSLRSITSRRKCPPSTPVTPRIISTASWTWEGILPCPPVLEPSALTRPSNGIRFSISDLSPPRSRLLHCVYRERAGISLYDALHESSPDSKPFHFSKHTITQVADTLGRFKGICDSYGVQKDHISVFATEAMRTAKNRDDMLQAIEAASGLTVDILSPGMESLFGAMGA